MAKLNPALALIGGIIIGCFLGKLRYKSEEAPPAEIRTDTITLRDTIRIEIPSPKCDTIIRYLTACLPLDTITPSLPSDSAQVILPITQATYTDSTTYTAWVSGYNPRLDSLHVYPQTRIITQTQTLPAPKSKPFALGLTTGYAITPKGVQPYIGIGITWKFAEF